MPVSDNSDVFVNCPFDNEYQRMFDALVFTIYKCGFRPRCSKEVDDAGENRLSKIVRIIGECRLAIHDISRTELGYNKLPRFNMPLELGIFLGAKQFGGLVHRNKQCLVFDREKYRYQKFISDIAGQDIQSHGGCAEKLVIAVRNWLATFNAGIPSGSIIWGEYNEFQRELPTLCQEAYLVWNELTFADYVRLVYVWVEHQESA